MSSVHGKVASFFGGSISMSDEPPRWVPPSTLPSSGHPVPAAIIPYIRSGTADRPELCIFVKQTLGHAEPRGRHYAFSEGTIDSEGRLVDSNLAVDCKLNVPACTQTTVCSPAWSASDNINSDGEPILNTAAFISLGVDCPHPDVILDSLGPDMNPEDVMSGWIAVPDLARITKTRGCLSPDLASFIKDYEFFTSTQNLARIHAGEFTREQQNEVNLKGAGYWFAANERSLRPGTEEDLIVSAEDISTMLEPGRAM